MFHDYLTNKDIRKGSINFEKKGGICCTFPSFPCCCNFNPVHYCCCVPDYFHLTRNNVLLFGEEPGPGCLGCPIIPCVLFFWCCCSGLCGGVNFHGLTFTVNNGKIDCKASNKHFFCEDLPVILNDVQDIRAVESPRRVYVPSSSDGEGGNYTPAYMACYDKLEILHRNAEGQIVVFQSFELQSPRHAEPYLEPGASRYGFCNYSGYKAREPLPPSDYIPYVAKVQAYISSNMSSVSLASRVTFAMYDANIFAQMMAAHAAAVQKQQQPVYYPVQEQITNVPQHPQLQPQQDQQYQYPVQSNQVVPMTQQPQQYSIVSTMPSTAAQNNQYYYPPPGQQEMQRGNVTTVTMASVVSVVPVETEMVSIVPTNTTTGVVYMGVPVEDD